MKIFLANGWNHYANWLDGDIVNNIEEADLVIFEGGEDVDPKTYGEKHGKWTDSNIERDIREEALFRKAVKLEKKILGICRGSQLICALSGGKLVQHQPNPHFIHFIITSTGDMINITSTHHQAQFPFLMEEGVDYKLLAWTEGMLDFHLGGNNKEMNGGKYKEAEIIYYPKTKALAIQGHPEMMKREKHSETFKYLDGLIKNLMEENQNERVRM